MNSVSALLAGAYVELVIVRILKVNITGATTGAYSFRAADTGTDGRFQAEHAALFWTDNEPTANACLLLRQLYSLFIAVTPETLANVEDENKHLLLSENEGTIWERGSKVFWHLAGGNTRTVRPFRWLLHIFGDDLKVCCKWSSLSPCEGLYKPMISAYSSRATKQITSDDYEPRDVTKSSIPVLLSMIPTNLWITISGMCDTARENASAWICRITIMTSSALHCSIHLPVPPAEIDRAC